MKILCSAVLAILVLGGNICHAGFLSAYTGSQTAPNSRTVKYTVWENTTNAATTVDGLSGSPMVGAGQFAYLYQVIAPADPEVTTFKAMVSNLRTTQYGAVDNMVFTGATTFASASNTRDVTISSAKPAGIVFNIAPSVDQFAPQTSSEIMYIVSNGAPTVGVGEFFGESFPSYAAVPVPVPLPATLGLAVLGVPFIRALRRRNS